MKVEIQVQIELKEIQDTVMSAARKVAGADVGGSHIDFGYDSQGKLANAVVTFQQQKSNRLHGTGD